MYGISPFSAAQGGLNTLAPPSEYISDTEMSWSIVILGNNNIIMSVILKQYMNKKNENTIVI